MKVPLKNQAFSLKLITFKTQITSEKCLVILGIKKNSMLHNRV